MKTQLTHGQQGLWFEWKLNPRNKAYNFSLQVGLSGELDLIKFKRAIKNFIDNCDVYRTYFTEEDSIPYRIYLETEELKEKVSNIVEPTLPGFDYIDLTLAQHNLEDSTAIAYDFHKKSIKKDFDLTIYPLFQFTLIRYAKDRYLFSLVVPQIITDTNTVDLSLGLLSEFYNYNLYTSQETKVENKLKCVKDQSQYLEHIQKNYTQTNKSEDELYWCKQLKGAKLQLDFNLAIKPTTNPHAGKRTYFTFNQEIVSGLLTLISALLQKFNFNQNSF